MTNESPLAPAIDRERYANHILCHEDLRGILEAWDRAEKKIFHGGVVLYRIR